MHLRSLAPDDPRSPAWLMRQAHAPRGGGRIVKPAKGDTTDTTALHSPTTSRRIIIDVNDEIDADLILNLAHRLPSARVVETGTATGGGA